MSKLAIIGAGAWGTALACVGKRVGHETQIWCRTVDRAEEINTGTNRDYLDDLKLELGLRAGTDLDEVLDGASVVLLSVPTQTLDGVLTNFQNLGEETILVTTCKGIDQQNGLLPAEIAQSRFPGHANAALSGPSFASDVVSGLPTAVTIGSNDITIADKVAQFLSTDTFRCYSSDDLKGVELGGALKNVLALAVGATRGMQLGASAEAALIARGFAEISRLAVSLGAKPETLMGLSGLGDMTLTCSSSQSRNFAYGMALGKGDSLEGLKLAEGAFTASVALRLANEKQIDVPITEAIVSVLEKRVTARQAVSQLLTRPLKREN